VESDSRWLRTPALFGSVHDAIERGRSSHLAQGKRGLAELTRLTGFVTVLGLWQLMSATGILATWGLPGPAVVAHTLWRLVATGTLGHNLEVSLLRVLEGVVIGCGVGGSLGIVSGLFSLGERLIDAPMQALRMLPHLALLPFLIVVMGSGELSKVVLIALGSFFPIYVNLFAGIRGIDGKLIEVGRSLGLSWLQLLRHVILPGALPQVLVGLRQSLGVAWLSLFVAEQVNATAGLGYLMQDAQELLHTDVLLICIGVYGILGLVTDAMVRWIERSALCWRHAPLGM